MTQDRIVVAIFEEREAKALSHIRRGEIADAVGILKGRWASLPGGKSPRKEHNGASVRAMTIADVIRRHRDFMAEFLGGTRAAN